MNNKIASAVASLGVLAAASTVSLATAAPASAVTRQCVAYLQSKSYAPTGERVDACYTAGHFNSWADKDIKYQACWGSLIATHVRTAHATTACTWAQTDDD
jgi:hypothetical protein